MHDALDLVVGYVETEPTRARRLIETHSTLLQAAAVRYSLSLPRILLEEIGVAVNDLDSDALDMLCDNELRPAFGRRHLDLIRLVAIIS